MSAMSRLILPLTTQYSTSASRAVSLKARLMASMTAASDTSRITISQSPPPSAVAGLLVQPKVSRREPCSTLRRGGSICACSPRPQVAAQPVGHRLGGQATVPGAGSP
jgi:hypothetical protein